MNPTDPIDPTLTHGAADPVDSSEAAWDVGLAAAFDPGATRSHSPTPDLEPGTILAGKYKLTERIGEGGMGSVWVAQQSEPVKRKVAVKLIKAGMDSKTVLARFEAERQALAVMDHPNIAKVLDGGLHENRPFFVMELVKGVPITDYCDKCKLTPKERLELFVPVCQAIQHAHQKGVIHRDIKPSNVLVALYDDKPVPKVIDFGVAKATGQALTDRTIDTAFGGVVGTPQYMSPEQASLNNLDIDTRSDVYSLGVLLYELLAGSPPFSRKELEKKGLLEMLRVVREEEPPRPSTKLSTADALPSLAANRGTEPKRLTGLLRSELDWVVMKALEKDRSRRYETANGFAADVQRYLAGEPVVAHPPTVGYRLRKFYRKHRAAIVTAVVFVVTLKAFAFFSWWQAHRAFVAEGKAEQQRDQAIDAHGVAQTERDRARQAEKLAGERLAQVDVEKKKAEEEKQIAQAVRDFLQNKLLGQADARTQANALLRTGGPEAVAESKENPTIRELLDRAAKELTPDTIDANFPNQPLVQAAILQTVGNAYRGVAGYDQAVGFLQRAVALFRHHLGPDHPDTLTCLRNLARTYHAAGQLDLALPLFEETLRLRRVKPGPDHPDTLTSMNNLALAYRDAGRWDLALPLFEETLRVRKAKFPPDHSDTLASMHNLALAHRDAGKLDLALPLFEETFTLLKAKFGPDHPDTLTGMSSLAGAYRAAGKHDLALPLLVETLRVRKVKFGLDHPSTLTSMANLASTYRSAGMLDLALPLSEETLRLRRAKLGPDHPDTLTSMNNLAGVYFSAKQFDKSIPLLEDVLRRKVAKLGRQHPETLMTAANLGLNYKDAGRLAEALPLLEEGHRAAKQYPTLRWVGTQLLDGYVQASKGEQASALAKDLLADARTQLPKDGPQLAGQLDSLGRSLLRARAFAEAEPLLRECLAIREKTQPNVWNTFNTQSMLGGALLGQKKYADAEPLLVAGYEGLKAREKTIPPQGNTRIPEALDRLIELYATTNKPDEAKKWRAERAKYPDVAPPPRAVKR